MKALERTTPILQSLRFSTWHMSQFLKKTRVNYSGVLAWMRFNRELRNDYESCKVTKQRAQAWRKRQQKYQQYKTCSGHMAAVILCFSAWSPARQWQTTQPKESQPTFAATTCNINSEKPTAKHVALRFYFFGSIVPMLQEKHACI